MKKVTSTASARSRKAASPKNRSLSHSDLEFMVNMLAQEIHEFVSGELGLPKCDDPRKVVQIWKENRAELREKLVSVHCSVVDPRAQAEEDLEYFDEASRVLTRALAIPENTLDLNPIESVSPALEDHTIYTLCLTGKQIRAMSEELGGTVNDLMRQELPEVPNAKTPLEACRNWRENRVKYFESHAHFGAKNPRCKDPEGEALECLENIDAIVQGVEATLKQAESGAPFDITKLDLSKLSPKSREVLDVTLRARGLSLSEFVEEALVELMSNNKALATA